MVELLAGLIELEVFELELVLGALPCGDLYTHNVCLDLLRDL